jgi:hypothetical protein
MAVRAIEPAAPVRFGTVRTPITVPVKDGQTVIPAGFKLRVLAVEGPTATVEYLDEVLKVPLSALEIEPASAVTPQPQHPAQLQHAPASLEAPAPKGEAITLRPGWDSRMQGGDVTLRELENVLSPYCSATTGLSGGAPEFFHGVRYLMPASAAVQVLGLSHRIQSAERVAATGFPRNSLSCSTFEGEFNRLDLVTDSADRVVCLQLVNQRPRTGDHPNDNDKWMTYNFLRNAMRSADTMNVSFKSRQDGETIVIETRLFQHYGRQHGNHFHVDRVEVKEKNRLFLPIPFARLILHCAENGLKK